MSLQIYNTMTRSREPFVPLEPGKVKMYVCGPTVYDYIHIGNARPVIVFDVVRSYLEYLGYDVNYVVNFTDVDDKLIRKARELNMEVPAVAEKFIAAYHEDLTGLNVPAASINPRVTESMDLIIDFIKDLVDKGYAYENDGDVFYRTKMFKDYGQLSGQNLEELQFGIRINVDERKENAEDFVLWKAAKPGEIYWSSPWGDGRPGWHIECSAMARHYLGDTLDIHGGGQDLQFPHHECECAQSEVITGKPLSRYWMHNGYIRIDNEKMSKSLGNGILVKDLRARHKPEALRYFMLSTHYRNPLNYNQETMSQAENSVERIANAVANVKHRLSMALKGNEAVSAELQMKLDGILQQFGEKMDDDFNTPDAITAVFEWVSEANLLLQRDVVNQAELQAVLHTFHSMNTVLRIYSEPSEELLDDEIEQLIAERVEARKTKNWGRADEIRDLLATKGIVLEDTAQGMRWRRK
ncbi:MULTISPECIES: cysteine--tRNA ligase [Paenibacillus]|jgi:cysteinyl-tRNA synthetase|uniref:cysteine--tRNA ligase n=1 Tax=Paenibacillus TaxID=44249 RepID=UPI000D307F98|nr:MULTISPECIES: cysteine--tRNA ligase [Paenibacillus]KAE8561406.1 cysteine--tRNA ligase [Paenibacillus polymyxa]KAF6578704.1 cysteine--tRNA ligase [Paenibacillus sp. EKM211P]KAF6614542.1 cysteine--tRNA ligase [Paenibacillus sp. EKM101P]KAF6617064.1 cysteine--tRNA ligase [Paenibacillus sp. EKM102P]KAF6625274.1 cysteine--tRNA ligase [Paenibacillus sp. EKM10P]